MWHRFLINGLAAAQYLTCLLAAAFLYWLIAAFVGMTGGGLSFVEFFLVLIPLLLASVGAGLSFFMPRVAAIVALVMTVPILLLGISPFFHGKIEAEPVFVIPSAVVILASIFALLWSEASVWRNTNTRVGRVAVVLLASAPGLFAVYAIIAMLWYLLVTSRQRAT